MTAAEVLRWLRQRLAQLSGVPQDTVDSRENFTRYGLDSLSGMQLIKDLGLQLGRSLLPTLLWLYPTPKDLAEYLGTDSVKPVPALPATTPPAPAGESSIAVVGLSCRFPMAPDVKAFWRLLQNGVDAITEVPTERWNGAALYDSDLRVAGKSNSRWGGFLSQVDGFDCGFFHISPREAAAMDPQQRLMLELTWEALEDAGIPPASLKDSQTGVFLGAIWNDYATLSAHQLAAIDQHTSTGQHLSIIPGRISYTLGLRGPSVAFNTACSSSLVAVHYARRSLQLRECSLAIAGGVNLMLSPDNMVALAKFGGLSAEGRCKAFAATANGFVRGEGGGLVVLKPLSAARADGNPIYCILLGSAVNNDGFSNGLTAPSSQAQEQVLRAAYADAGVSACNVQYVETHGTGTFLGDPIEAGALGVVLGAGRDADRPLLIGSVKTNIGHLEAAAGVAGLIKTILAMQHQQIPPNLHFDAPNPSIDFYALHLQVPTRTMPWEKGVAPQLAGVSSFGFSGTNCHVVISSPADEGSWLLPLSAATEIELQARVTKLKSLAADFRSPLSLAALQQHLSAGSPERYRLALTVSTRAELVDALETYLQGRQKPGVVAGIAADPPSSPVFAFGGQGSQWRRMGADLLSLPAFRAAVARAERAFVSQHGQHIFPTLLSDADRWLDDTSLVQPAIFVLQAALADLLIDLGIKPGAVIGQSLGEMAAAYIAGCLSLEDAARVVQVRSQAVHRVSGQGAMIVTDLSPEEARQLIAGRQESVAVAVSSPHTTVLSGDNNQITELVGELGRRGRYVRKIRVDYASHTSQVDPLLPAIHAALDRLHPQHESIPFYSTVTGHQIAGVQLDASYWCRNEREPFRLQEAMAQVGEDGFRIFLDVNPHPVLTRSMQECLQQGGHHALVLPLMRREEAGRKTLLDALGALWVGGQELRWDRLFNEAEPPAMTPPDLGIQRRLPTAPAKPVLLPLSARSAQALHELARSWTVYLAETALPPLADIVYTAGCGRDHLPHRLAVLSRTPQELSQQLQTFVSGQTSPGLFTGTSPSGATRKLVFVFPGQGGQWIAMGRQLMANEPVFRQAVTACDHHMREYGNFSLLEILQGEGPDAALDHVAVIQPAIFAVQLGLCALWRSWGVEPAAVVGHSMGEVAAACAAGWLTVDAACRVICLRSQLVRRVSGQGTMAVVELPVSRAQEVILPYSDTVAIAAINGPRTVILSGLRSALAEILLKLEAAGIFCRWIKVDYASHSAQMDVLTQDLLQGLATLHGTVGQVPMYSTVTGQWVAAPLTAAYWQANLRQPVQFWQSLQALAEDGCDTFLEIGPHPVLLPTITEALGQQLKSLAVIASMRRDDGELAGPRAALGTLYAHGYPVDWAKQSPTGGRIVALPAYPWQRQRYWIETPPASLPTAAASGGHPLLGLPMQLATQPGARVFVCQLDNNRLTYVKDHRVQEAVVLPAAAYVEMAWAAAKELWEHTAFIVEDLKLHEAMTLDSKSPKRVQTVVTQEVPGRLFFQVFSQKMASDPWCLHAAARISKHASASSAAPGPISAIRDRCIKEVTADSFYAARAEQGLVYGPAFSAVVKAYQGKEESLGYVRLPAGEQSTAAQYTMHPALLDGCLQLLVAAVPPHVGPVVPVKLGSVRVHGWPGKSVWSHAQLYEVGSKHPGRFHGTVRLFDEEERLLIEFMGIELQALEPASRPKVARYWVHQWRPTEAATQKSHTPTPRILILADKTGVAQALEHWLTGQGADVFLLHAGTPATWSLPGLTPGRTAFSYTAVVYLGSLDQPFGTELCSESIEQAQRRDYGAVLQVVQELTRAGLRDAPRLWLVTRGVHAASAATERLSPAAGILWGLGRTIAHEHPELRCTRVDLHSSSWTEEVAALGTALLGDDPEEELALRPSGRFVARLTASAELPTAVETYEPAAGRSFQLTSTTPGSLQHLTLHLQQRRAPQAGEVEIEVRAAGLNFIDVMLAMGIYPDQDPNKSALGIEFAGVIVAVGDGVTGLAIGDEVIGLGSGSFSSHVTTAATLVIGLPASLRYTQGAAVPANFLTAYYALHTLARLQKGERVLIHSAASGTGLAALRIAQKIGAEVFATCSSAEKRDYLHACGIEHVMDSRSLDFAEQVLALTQGRGVDVVVNSLSGAAIGKSFTALAPYGRFVELGKRDIYDNTTIDLGHFRKKLAYFTVDLAAMMHERPQVVAKLLRQVVQEFAAGTLTPPPVQVLPISHAQDAFRLMAKGGHIGKLVLDLADSSAEVTIGADGTEIFLRNDVTYLITGGLGGLGLSAAKWLATRGARHLVLLGRKGADSAEQKAAVTELEALGVEVLVAQADVTRSEDVQAVLAHIKAHLPALRGVIHAAGLLDDALLMQQDVQRFTKVMAPKVLGAWNLHEQTRTTVLDFFVMYSSAAAILGLPGQGNYAAANAFLDALAHYRQASGLPALSINWGAFAQVGLASVLANRGQRLAGRGMKSLTPQEGNAELGQLLPRRLPQIGVMTLDLRQWTEYYPQSAASTLLADVLQQARTSQASPRHELELPTTLRAATAAQRTDLLTKYVREQLAQVLRMPPAQIGPDTPFKSLGVDSLLGLEFRNLLEAGLGLKLAATLIWTYPDVARLAAHLGTQLLAPESTTQEVIVSVVAKPGLAKSQLDDLSDAELAQLGNELLD